MEKSYFKKLMSGEVSMGKVFWLYKMLIPVILYALLLLLTTITSITSPQIGIYTIFSLIYGFVILFALFKSSIVYQGKKIWKFLVWAIIAVNIVLALVIQAPSLPQFFDVEAERKALQDYVQTPTFIMDTRAIADAVRDGMLEGQSFEDFLKEYKEDLNSDILYKATLEIFKEELPNHTYEITNELRKL